MARQSIAQRAEQLRARGSELAGTGPDLHPVHIATANVLTDLMNLGSRLSNDTVPQHLRILMTMLDKGRPMLLEGISSLEPDAIKAFMSELVARINTIIDTPTERGSRDSDSGADHPRADIAETA